MSIRVANRAIRAAVAFAVRRQLAERINEADFLKAALQG